VLDPLVTFVLDKLIRNALGIDLITTVGYQSLQALYFLFVKAPVAGLAASRFALNRLFGLSILIISGIRLLSLFRGSFCVLGGFFVRSGAPCLSQIGDFGLLDSSLYHGAPESLAMPADAVCPLWTTIESACRGSNVAPGQRRDGQITKRSLNRP